MRVFELFCVLSNIEPVFPGVVLGSSTSFTAASFFPPLFPPAAALLTDVGKCRLGPRVLVRAPADDDAPPASGVLKIEVVDVPNTDCGVTSDEMKAGSVDVPSEETVGMSGVAGASVGTSRVVDEVLPVGRLPELFCMVSSFAGHGPGD